MGRAWLPIKSLTMCFSQKLKSVRQSDHYEHHHFTQDQPSQFNLQQFSGRFFNHPINVNEVMFSFLFGSCK